MKNTVIFGGTFNPPHMGHIQMLECILNMKSTDKVIVIPTSIPPHKVCKTLAGDADRLNMCKIAFGGRERVSVSDLEMKRKGKSYTFDTLNALRKNGENNLAIVCGGDMIVTFTQWYRFDEILKMAEIIAIRRDGIDNTEFDKSVENLKTFGGRITVLSADILGISSTEIRENIGNEKYLLEYLPKGVYDYITEKELYIGE